MLAKVYVSFERTWQKRLLRFLVEDMLVGSEPSQWAFNVVFLDGLFLLDFGEKIKIDILKKNIVA